MDYSVDALDTHNVASRVDAQRTEIKCRETVVAEQESTHDTVAHIKSHNVAARVDAGGLGQASARDVNRRDTVIAAQKAMLHPIGYVESYDVPTRVDPDGLSRAGARDINRREDVGLRLAGLGLQGHAQAQTEHEQGKCH